MLTANDLLQEDLMKHLMSTINTTLQDSLLNSRAGSASLNSGLLTPDSMEESMR